MFSIGEFSRRTGLTVKTLRYYHKQEILLPDYIDSITGYRYYGENAARKAWSVNKLKDIGLTLMEIKEVLLSCSEDEDLGHVLDDKIRFVEERISELGSMRNKLLSLKNSISTESVESLPEVKEWVFPDTLICGIRLTGKYSDAGKGFAELYRKAGKVQNGKPMIFYYDMEYKEDNAEMETCFAVRKDINDVGVESKLFRKRKVVSALHTGGYGTQGPAYGIIFDYCRKRGYSPELPFIERYIKGPGIIFKRRPSNYLTEIIIPVRG